MSEKFLIKSSYTHETKPESGKTNLIREYPTISMFSDCEIWKHISDL